VERGIEHRTERRTIGVILAGGIGLRVGAGMPKQLIPVGGRPLLSYPVETFGAAGLSRLLLVMARGHEDAARGLVDETGAGTGGRPAGTVVTGGASRTESTLRALDALADEADDALVLFHDAARAFVDPGVIGRCLAGLETYECVSVALPVTDTIIAVKDGHVVDSPPRESLARVQTPQGFRLGTLRRAYELAGVDPGFVATDDCGVVHRYLPGVPIGVVAGGDHLLKITTPLDLVLAEHLARTR
jgi:2-C-methyl-D-erythritol 4-phosphate cytidylyltransferase